MDKRSIWLNESRLFRAKDYHHRHHHQIEMSYSLQSHSLAILLTCLLVWPVYTHHLINIDPSLTLSTQTYQNNQQQLEKNWVAIGALTNDDYYNNGHYYDHSQFSFDFYFFFTGKWKKKFQFSKQINIIKISNILLMDQQHFIVIIIMWYYISYNYPARALHSFLVCLQYAIQSGHD